MSKTKNRVSSSLHQAADSSGNFVGHHPISTTLAAFGLGLGLGVAAVYLLVDQASHESLAQRVKHQVLDAVSKAVPESLSKYGH